MGSADCRPADSEPARCETNGHVWIVPRLNNTQGWPYDRQHCICGRAVWDTSHKNARILPAPGTLPGDDLDALARLEGEGGKAGS